jgi:hypothetical protein
MKATSIKNIRKYYPKTCRRRTANEHTIERAIAANINNAGEFDQKGSFLNASQNNPMG